MAARGTTKAALLDMLQQQPGRSFSGQQLAEKLGISRAAVHKAAAALQKQGYKIDAAAGKGYALQKQSDVLTDEAFARLLTAQTPIAAHYVYEELPGTNREARRMAQEGCAHGTVVIAGRQTNGRGRLGRSFISPEGGVYLSVVLRPHAAMADALPATGCAAVAVCRAVEKLCGLSLGIKWVNDLFYKGKKVCGILTEASADFETGRVEYLVVGIGLNLYTNPVEFGEEVGKIAGSLYVNEMPPCSRLQLAAEIAQTLLTPDLHQNYLEEYRSKSLVTGHYLTVTGDGEPYTAFAEGIEDDGCLRIRLASGGTKPLRFGEVSIRPAPGSLK